MKEIKFRYYEKDGENRKKGMVYGKPDNTNMEYFFGNADRNNNLMQYTGLKDENGRGIYEGDIIGYTNKDFLHNQPKYLVYYAVNEGNYPAFDVKPRIDEITCNGLQFLVENYQVKVIGNKYEDPELLE